ncbi:MAG: alpha/beta hydrolase [Pseudomonadota bacterium]|nr:alpha/beta hydrolase [Pseudomonadota bacterium]MEC8524843.1 alpha/beta hydrolase [Pseudomonadota bacterium]
MSMMQTIMRRLVTLTVKSQLNPRVTVATQRKRLDLLRFTPMPGGIKERSTELAGIDTRQLTPTPCYGAILYLHGGAYCTGSPDSHREMVARIARTTEREAFILNYRLAPEHPYPAALDDAMAAYTDLLSRHQDIVLVGDSAGGGLAMALAERISQTDYAQPNAMVLLSPWCDLTCSGPTMESNRRIDPMLHPDWLTSSAAMYAAESAKDEPGISPLFGDMSGYPRTLIQVGSDEILLSDATRAEAAMKEAGVDVTLQVSEGMWHVFQFHAAILKSSKKAVYKIGNFLRG